MRYKSKYSKYFSTNELLPLRPHTEFSLLFQQSRSPYGNIRTLTSCSVVEFQLNPHKHNCSNYLAYWDTIIIPVPNNKEPMFYLSTRSCDIEIRLFHCIHIAENNISNCITFGAAYLGIGNQPHFRYKLKRTYLKTRETKPTTKFLKNILGIFFPESLSTNNMIRAGTFSIT